MSITMDNGVLQLAAADAGTAVVLPGKIFPKSLAWSGGTTIGHVCIVTDAQDRELFRASIDAPGQTVESALAEKFKRGVEGLKVPTLQSGDLQIFLGG